MMEGLKKRTRKAFGIRKKEKDTDSTGSPDRDSSKKANGAPNGFYAEIDWERYTCPEVDDEGYSIRPDMEPGSTKGKHFYSSSESEEEQESRKKFNIRIKPLQAKDSLKSAATVDELKASIGNIALSPSPVNRSRQVQDSELVNCGNMQQSYSVIYIDQESSSTQIEKEGARASE